jgi:hypothetical protein
VIIPNECYMAFLSKLFLSVSPFVILHLCRYTVGRITPEPTRDICLADFGPKARIWMRFPSEGSKFTPPHQSVDFRWKDYCPMVFRSVTQSSFISILYLLLSWIGFRCRCGSSLTGECILHFPDEYNLQFKYVFNFF